MQIMLKLHNKINKIKTEEKTIEDLLKKLNINTESVLVKRNGKFVPIEDGIKDKDEIEVIVVVSSG